MKSKSIALCLAVYNEEKFIRYALDSCIDWVDEVVIVDGGSKDETLAIMESYRSPKITVYHEDNPPMFHINKQKAIERAKSDWILQLDADEEVSTELRAEIQAIIGSHDSKQESIVAYWISRKNLFLGRFLTKGGVYPDRTIRLYRNGVAHFPCKTVHENVEVKGIVGSLKSDLLHYADPEFGRYLARWVRYNKLDVQLLIDQHTQPRFMQYCLWKPMGTFLSMYGRHKGFMDGWQGFVFAFFSSIRYIDIYLRYRKIMHRS